jgi:hypothetical protein
LSAVFLSRGQKQKAPFRGKMPFVTSLRLRAKQPLLRPCLIDGPQPERQSICRCRSLMPPEPRSCSSPERLRAERHIGARSSGNDSFAVESPTSGSVTATEHGRRVVRWITISTVAHAADLLS